MTRPFQALEYRTTSLFTSSKTNAVPNLNCVCETKIKTLRFSSESDIIDRSLKPERNGLCKTFHFSLSILAQIYRIQIDKRIKVILLSLIENIEENEKSQIEANRIEPNRTPLWRK